MLNIPFLNNALTKLFQPCVVDDHVDRINYLFTSSLLCFFALTVSAKQYVGSPIQCWVPMEFRNAWEQYAEDLCFIKNTYSVAGDEPIPISLDARKGSQINYYQWVPIVLALQALVFYLPNWVWMTAQRKRDGVDIENVLFETSKLRTMSAESRNNQISKIVKHIVESLLLYQREGRSLTRCFTMSELYLSVKLLYLFNIVGQFLMLNAFIGRGYAVWGFNVIDALWSGNGTAWHESTLFPRISFCDFEIRQLGSLHGYTIQCVLMINMFNEKIYLFIWFWFLMVGICTMFNFLLTSCSLLRSQLRENKFKMLLQGNVTEAKDLVVFSHQNVKQFVNRKLTSDGVLLVHFIEHHAGCLVAHEIIFRLFHELMYQPKIPSAKKQEHVKLEEEDEDWFSIV